MLQDLTRAAARRCAGSYILLEPSAWCLTMRSRLRRTSSRVHVRSAILRHMIPVLHRNMYAAACCITRPPFTDGTDKGKYSGRLWWWLRLGEICRSDHCLSSRLAHGETRERHVGMVCDASRWNISRWRRVREPPSPRLAWCSNGYLMLVLAGGFKSQNSRLDNYTYYPIHPRRYCCSFTRAQIQRYCYIR